MFIFLPKFLLMNLIKFVLLLHRHHNSKPCDSILSGGLFESACTHNCFPYLCILSPFMLLLNILQYSFSRNYFSLQINIK